MGLAAFNRYRREQKQAEKDKAEMTLAEKHDQFVKECEAKGLDPQLMALDKETLETYAMNTFGINLDKRKGLEALVREVMALEDANPDEEDDLPDMTGADDNE